jgi:hypothetical protein
VDLLWKITRNSYSITNTHKEFPVKKIVLTTASVTAFVVMSATAFAQTPAAPPVNMPRPVVSSQLKPTPEQARIRECLTSKLGKPGQGAPPDTAKIQAAFAACNVKAPPMGAVKDSGTATPPAPPKNKYLASFGAPGNNPGG